MSTRIPKVSAAARVTGAARASANAQPDATAAYFTPQAVTFLQRLARNNNREWFLPRKEFYLEHLRAPMLRLTEEVTKEFAAKAPEFVRAPEKSQMRIYRDTRFAKDKRPYKRNVAAWFAAAGLEKTSGTGFYMHLAPDGFHIAAGVYMPDREQLRKLRAHIAENHARMRKLMAAPALKRVMRAFDGQPLSRPPKGYSAEHPAMDLIQCQQWGVSANLPVEAAFSPSLATEVRKRFRAALPLVQFLNEPLLTREKPRQLSAFRLP